jgi:hypothetical protein
MSGNINWHLKGQPWAVQTAALEKAAGRAKFGHMLEQGLGKTSLTLNEFVQSDVELGVFFSPKSFMLDWAAAPKEWGADIKTACWPMNLVNLDKFMKGNGKKLIATNYEQTRAGRYGDLLDLIERVPTFLTLDEASVIKTANTGLARAVIDLSKCAKYVRELNGTPFTQSVADWYPQLRCLGQLNGVKFAQFKARYTELGGFMGKKIVGSRNEDELARIIDSCCFRALKRDWRKGLPPQVFTPVALDMTPTQRARYREMKLDFYTSVDGLDVEARLVLTQMDKLRQISSCLIKDGDNERMIEPVTSNPKVKATLDILRGGTTKTIVVYTYKLSGRVLLQALEDEGLNPTFLKGQMVGAELFENKRRFNEDPDCRVIVCQEAASCMGHTLIGGGGPDRCNRMIYYENSFSLRDRLQMNDRIHRGDQDLECQYYDLICTPMDKKVFEALRSKQNQAEFFDEIILAAQRREI